MIACKGEPVHFTVYYLSASITCVTRVNGTLSISTNKRLLNQYPCTRYILIDEVMTYAPVHDVVEFKRFVLIIAKTHVDFFVIYYMINEVLQQQKHRR